MKVVKASNIGNGISIPYKKTDFEANMRLTSPFTVSINEKQHNLVINKRGSLSDDLIMLCVWRKDRVHHQLLMCPVNGCTTTFESEENLDAHIAVNLHKIPSEDPRISNDITRLHLIETVRSANFKLLHDVKRNQSSSTNVTYGSEHYQYFSSVGWALHN